MRFTLSIRTDNAAFEETPATEIARILREVAARVEDAEGAFDRAKIYDSNGNHVGTFGAED